MMSNFATDTNSEEIKPSAEKASAIKYVSQAAMLACILAGSLLGFRTLTSPDIGYHLAYGEHFLRTGWPVDSSPELYTVPGHATALYEEGNPPGPGCWYDSDGRYRFPNANWLSQVLFAIVHNWLGLAGLSALGGMVVFGIFAVSAVTMRRLGVSPAWTGAGLLLIALTAYERFTLRPELMGYFMLTCELCLLLPGALTGKGLGWGKIAAVAILQLLLVNLHSYWLLGLGITVAILAEEILRLLWLRFAKNDACENMDSSLIRRTKMLAILLGIQIILAFANPWTWRLALMPFQTLVFFRENQITSVLFGLDAHPWSIIAEFFPPFYNGLDSFSNMQATNGLYITLALTAAGLVASTITRKWASAFLLLGFCAVSMRMRRNIAPGAIIMVPIALAGVVCIVKKASAKTNRLKHPAYSIATSAVILILAGLIIFMVVSQKFYFNERRPERFGLGPSLIALPINASAWLSEHKPHGNVWTEYNAASNFYYFTEPHPAVPILTNTWAYPPSVMKEVLDTTRGIEPFRKMELRYDIQVVAISINGLTAAHRKNNQPVVQQLLARPDWSLVYIDSCFAIFLKNTGPNAALAKANEIKPWQFDIPAFIAKLKTQDSVPAFALQNAALTLQRFRWFNQSIELSQAAIQESPNYHQAWFEMGASHALMAQINIQQHRPELAKKDLENAKTCFQNCLKIEPDYKYAKTNLKAVNIDLQRFER